MAGCFWDRTAGVYDLTQRISPAAEAAVRRAAGLIPAGASVLDCAAGTGAFSLAAAERAGLVLCTDLSQPMLDRAAAKAQRQGARNIRFARRDLTALPERDGGWQVVIAANVLHLLPEPERAVAALWRATAPGGLLLLPTYLQGEASPLFRGILALWRLLGFRPCRRFTRESYAAFLCSCGLSAQVERIPGCLPVGFAAANKSEWSE